MEKKIKYCPIAGPLRETHQGFHKRELREAAKRRRRELDKMKEKNDE